MSKVIKMFLANDTASGWIRCTMDSWTGVVYKIPRSQLDSFKTRDDLKYSGVYFLLGDNDLYIGKVDSAGILPRLLEHERVGDNWNEAIVCTKVGNSFGQIDVDYIAKKFCNLTVAAKRYTVKSDGDFSQVRITEERESELDEFVATYENVIATLGYKIFLPLDKTPAQESPNFNGDFFDMLDAMTKCDITVNTKNNEWRIDNQRYYHGNLVTKEIAISVFYERNNKPANDDTDNTGETSAQGNFAGFDNVTEEGLKIYNAIKTISTKKLPTDIIEIAARYGLTLKARPEGGKNAGLVEWVLDGKSTKIRDKAADIFLERYNAAMNIAPESETAVVDTITDEETITITAGEALIIADIIENSAIEDISAEIFAIVKRYGLATLEIDGTVEWCVDGNRITQAMAAEIFLERYSNPDNKTPDDISTDDKTPTDIDNREESVNVPSVNNAPPLLLYITRKLRGKNFVVEATCKMISKEWFIVLKGSRIYPRTSKSLNNETVKKARRKARRDSDNRLLKDEILPSVSAAAEFVIGNNCNGLDYWKTSEGIPA